MMRIGDRSGMAPGDALLVLASLAFVFAVAYPRLERVALHRRTAAVSFAVRTVQDGARRYWSEEGRWPAGDAEGQVPAEMAPQLPDGFSFQHADYTLTWDRWETLEALPVDSAQIPEPPILLGDVPAPAALDSLEVVPPRDIPLGGITVRASDPRILAALLEEFGPARAFLREGSWTLVLTPGP